MRSRIRKIGIMLLLAVGLLTVQAGIQLLHHHYSDSYHGSKDGFHTLNTAVTCPATGAHSNASTSAPFLTSTAFVFSSPLNISNDVIESDIKIQFSASPVSGDQSRASPA
jgi:hypothetical protein